MGNRNLLPCTSVLTVLFEIHMNIPRHDYYYLTGDKLVFIAFHDQHFNNRSQHCRQDVENTLTCGLIRSIMSRDDTQDIFDNLMNLPYLTSKFDAQRVANVSYSSSFCPCFLRSHSSNNRDITNVNKSSQSVKIVTSCKPCIAHLLGRLFTSCDPPAIQPSCCSV